MSCCRVRGVFQAPQAAWGRSVTHHSLPEDAFKIPTCSVVTSPSRLVPPALSGKQKHSRVNLFTFDALYSITLQLTNRKWCAMKTGTPLNALTRCCALLLSIGWNRHPSQGKKKGGAKTAFHQGVKWTSRLTVCQQIRRVTVSKVHYSLRLLTLSAP